MFPKYLERGLTLRDDRDTILGSLLGGGRIEECEGYATRWRLHREQGIVVACLHDRTMAALVRRGDVVRAGGHWEASGGE